MTTVDLRSYLPRLARRFDETLHTSDGGERGWGQFLTAETLQVGPYGTCAGVLVKLAADPNAHIDEGVVSYLQTLWGERRGGAARYFDQTVRLTFLVLALPRATDPRLILIRDEAATEVQSRQRPDGSWADWPSADAPPRLETTSWAVLALSRVNHLGARAGAVYLQTQLLAFTHLDERCDPWVLAVALHALQTDVINSRLVASGVQLLTRIRPSNDLQIYFFDYETRVGRGMQPKRDFLCVPRFVGYCILASAPAFQRRLSSLSGLRLAVAHQRGVEHLASVLEGEPLHGGRSRFPATVDQAFVALSVEYLSKRPVQLGMMIRMARPAYRWARHSIITRVLLPVLIIALLGTCAQEPNRLAELWARVPGLHGFDLSTFVKANADLIQFGAILASFVVGQPLLSTVLRFIKEKWRGSC